MANTTLGRAFDLTAGNVDVAVRTKTPGAYALSALGNGTFYVDYVGRSDTDLNNRLKSWIGKYRRFAYICLESSKAAFDAECNLYHDYTPRDNAIHPDRPANSNWRCPRCRIFG